MTEPVVALRHVSHTYLAGTPDAVSALEDASLTVERGEIAALVGPAGAGKSTLTLFLNGLLRPPEPGQVVILGQDTASSTADLPSLRSQVGLVTQYPHAQLFERYVGDDVAYGPRQMGLSGEALRIRVRWAMETVGLPFETFVDRRTFTLSGGELRRVALAGVLAMQPEILVLDESTAGLDPRGRNQVHELLRRLRGEQGTTVLLVSNEMDEVAELADRVTLLDHGRTVGEGPAREILAQPELLQGHGLLPPEAVSIASSLKVHGIPLPDRLITSSQVEEALWRVLSP